MCAPPLVIRTHRILHDDHDNHGDAAAPAGHSHQAAGLARRARSARAPARRRAANRNAGAALAVDVRVRRRSRHRGGWRQRLSAECHDADAGELSQRRCCDQRAFQPARPRSDRHRCRRDSRQHAQRAAAELDRAGNAQFPLRAGDERRAMHARHRNRPHIRDRRNRSRLQRAAARRDGNRQHGLRSDAAASTYRMAARRLRRAGHWPRRRGSGTQVPGAGKPRRAVLAYCRRSKRWWSSAASSSRC